jgi:energy-converting hydrogenase Eha subunit E
MNRFTRIVLFGQSIYFLLTGIWPLISIESFQAVTGPKVDLWLVKMVGLLAAVIGLSLLVATVDKRLLLETFILAIGGAASFAIIDLIYALSGRISPIYLLDAVVQVILIILVSIGWLRSNDST